MEDLSSSLLVWPPPRESFFYRQEWELVRRLDSVANSVTKTNRPRTQILHKTEDFTESTVLKREGSCWSKHRIFYDYRTACKDVKAPYWQNKMILNGRKNRDNLDAKHGMLWLVQDLVEELRTYGEYRVYVVASKVVSVVATTPVHAHDRLWNIKDCQAVYGLTELT